MADTAPAFKHDCPPYCHFCPDMDGDVMGFCGGTLHRNDLDRCYCDSEEAAAREGSRRLADNHLNRLPPDLARRLREYADSPIPRRGKRQAGERAGGRT